MSHSDPYGSEPRGGWDQPERPVALPWPEQELEAGQWSRRPAAGPELYADPHTRPYADPRPADPYDERARPARPDDRFDDRDRHDRFDDLDRHVDDRNQPDRYDDRGRGDRFPDRPPAPGGGPPRYEGPDRGRLDEPGPPARLDDPGYPTEQLAPVRAEVVPDEASTTARRSKGRRRASLDRPATQQVGTGRAGRNLPAAIGVGLGLGALIVVPLVVYPLAFLPVIAAAVAIGMWEMARAVRRSGAHPPLVPLIAGGVLTVGLAWFAGPDALSLGLLVTVLGTMIWRLGDGPAGFQRDLTAATLIAVYVPFLAGFAALLAAAPDDGRLRVLATLIGVVLSDTGGYAAGVSFGRHPMAPSISPKKSWEGFAGSVTAAAVGSAVLLWLMFEVAPWWGALFGVAVSCAAVLGDLAESMIKRDLGVKDMSNLLPGHGGLMDRLDSVLFAVPTAYLLLAVLVPVVS
ncbi:phosphatidate cytidylyltransferase [Micromonospora sp. NPDC005710]|uniref:phosphatidate cytidylyltransferase n=1 Tax=Micromonospora sp. NPDC005710 TaxID=3157051 RepID=UPI0033FC7052